MTDRKIHGARVHRPMSSRARAASDRIRSLVTSRHAARRRSLQLAAFVSVWMLLREWDDVDRGTDREWLDYVLLGLLAAIGALELAMAWRRLERDEKGVKA